MSRRARRRVDSRAVVRARLDDEVGTIRKDAPHRIALVYPSPYHVGMSSLGFQQIYRRFNERPDLAAERAFLPDAECPPEGTLTTYESGRPVGDAPIIALSVAYEIELAGVIRVLELAGLAPLAAERSPGDPVVVAGGPLTFSNPAPLLPFVDVLVLGEADQLALDVVDAVLADPSLERASTLPSVLVPSLSGTDLPPVARADDSLLPARSAIRTPHTELRSMFLVEPERGCSRGCTYCVMRRTTNGGMRVVDADTVLAHVPDDATRVGLVGAAVSDHPKIVNIVRTLADRGIEVGLSSLRPDRLREDFVSALADAGYKTLTTAADGASQRLRRTIERGAKEDHLRRAATLAREHGMKRLKLYLMLGLPDETDEDVDELVGFSLELSRILPVSFGVAPFVSKRNTPLDGRPFAGVDVVDARIKRFRSGVRGRVEVRPTSARWAWVEYVLAQGGPGEGRAVLDAVRAGGRFADYRKAFAACGDWHPTAA